VPTAAVELAAKTRGSRTTVAGRNKNETRIVWKL
jgi:hypothetical protein